MPSNEAKFRGRVSIEAAFERARETWSHANALDLALGDRDALLELDSATEFAEPITEHDRREILHEALTATLSRGLDANALLSQVREAERSYLARPLTPFVVATSLSIRPPARPIRTKVGESTTITISARHPSRIAAARLAIDRPPIPEPDRFPHGYSAVRVRVNARTVYQAVDSALDALDLVRGCWNYALNWRVWRSSRPGEDVPINQVLLGRIHTAHTTDGRNAHDGGSYFYQPAAAPQRWILGGTRTMQQILAAERQMRRRLVGVPYRPELERAIVRYCRALDGIDFEWVFARLWGVLESLTATTGRHEQTVKRTGFLWDQTARTLSTLEHLRERRNGIVHFDVGSDLAITLVYQVKGYVESLIHFHLTNRGTFADLRDVAQFLDLPPEPEKLNELKALYRRAVRFRRPAEEPETGAEPQAATPTST